jgi:hypothetical protein
LLDAFSSREPVPASLEDASRESIPLMAFTQHWKLARVLPTFQDIAVGA